MKKETITKDGITYLPIAELFPHPDNPRKDLGDISELADSIKAKGILQNLTVVPGHTENGKEIDDGYTVIIGHRRMAAAKIAGLTELPCVITRMSEQEQISTMLLENMQRSDLTVYEQAKGFQMMLDLGETVESVAEKSGFSQTTIRRRVKLLDLDQDKFKKSEARGGTIQDYIELEKIKDVDRKNKVLDAIGTADFQYQLKRAIDVEKNEEYLKFVEAEVSKFAKKVENTSSLQYVCQYGTWNKKTSIPVPEDSDTVEYFYDTRSESVSIYKNKEQDAEDNKDAERDAELERKKEELKAAEARTFELRSTAVNCFSNSYIIKHLSDMVEFLYKSQLHEYNNFGDDEIYEALGINADDEEFENMTDEEIEDFVYKEIEKKAVEMPGVLLIKAVYGMLGDSVNTKFADWRGKYSGSETLDLIYEFLCKLGYEMSNEEKALQDGTSELFITDEED